MSKRSRGCGASLLTHPSYANTNETHQTSVCESYPIRCWMPLSGSFAPAPETTCLIALTSNDLGSPSSQRPGPEETGNGWSPVLVGTTQNFSCCIWHSAL